MLVGDVEPQIEGKIEKKLFSNGLGQFFSSRKVWGIRQRFAD